MNTEPPHIEPAKMLGLVSLGLILGVLGAEALIRAASSELADGILRVLRAITSGI